MNYTKEIKDQWSWVNEHSETCAFCEARATKILYNPNLSSTADGLRVKSRVCIYHYDAYKGMTAKFVGHQNCGPSKPVSL